MTFEGMPRSMSVVFLIVVVIALRGFQLRVGFTFTKAKNTEILLRKKEQQRT